MTMRPNITRLQRLPHNAFNQSITEEGRFRKGAALFHCLLEFTASLYYVNNTHRLSQEVSS